MKLNEVIKKTGVSAIIYGESGMGKTHFLGTLPGKTLICASEVNGLRCLTKSANVDNIDIEVLPRDVEGIVKYFDNLLIRKEVYDNVCLDSASELDKVLMMGKADPNKNGGVPPQKAYLETQFILRRCLRDLKDLSEQRGSNVIITALETPLTLSIDGEVENAKAYPAISTKKFPPEACSYYDIVAHLEITGKGDRFFRLTPSDKVMAKDRWNRKGCFAEGKILLSGLTGTENLNDKETK